MNKSSYPQGTLALIEEITAAFDGVSREGGVSLHEAYVLDDVGQYATAEDLAEERSKDTETRWQDVPDDDIWHGHTCLSFFNEISFRYYIPAYIVWYLRHFDEGGDPESPLYGANVFGDLIYSLKLSKLPQFKEFTLSRFVLFTPEQSKAIAHFLEFDAEREDALNAEIIPKMEPEWRINMASNGFSPEQIDAHFKNVKENVDARVALNSYWGEFLEKPL